MTEPVRFWRLLVRTQVAHVFLPLQNRTACGFWVSATEPRANPRKDSLRCHNCSRMEARRAGR